MANTEGTSPSLPASPAPGAAGDAPRPAPPDAPGAPPTRRRRALRRAAILALVALPLLYFALTRSVIVRRAVERRLEAITGASVTLDSASFDITGRLSARGVRIRATSVAGPAGEALTARRVDAYLDLRALLRRSVVVTRIVMREPLVRLSASPDGGDINVLALGASASGGALGALPRIEVIDGAIEFGEHDGPLHTPLFRLPISGRASPDPARPSAYLLRFQGWPDDPKRIVLRGVKILHPAPPTVLDGRVDLASFETELRLSNVDLSAWGDHWAPIAVRDRWNAFTIEGRIPRTVFSFTREAGAEAEISLEHVGLTLPVEAQDDPDHPPAPGAPPPALRMTDVTGAIRFGRNALGATLTGLIEDLRCRVNFRAEGLALNAPFRMEVETAEPFTVERRPSLLPFAPRIVRERLRTFSGPTAVVEAQTLITRGAPDEAGAPAPTRVNGLIRFRDGRARFDRFPYPISNLAGIVRFTDEEIRIESITGVGPTGARLLAEGTIVPPTDGSEVNLRFAVVDMPIDAHLADALPEAQRGVVGAMFDAAARDRLQALGLIQPVRERAEAERALLDARTREAVLLARGEAPPPALASEIAALEARAAIPAFDLGGPINLDIRVHRAAGHGDGLWTSDTRVSMPEVGMLPAVFPFPLIARNGDVRILDEHATVSLPELLGAHGGAAAVAAEVSLFNERNERVIRPVVTLEAHDIPVCPALIAALPDAPLREHADTGEGGASAPRTLHELLLALALSGTVDCAARIEPRSLSSDDEAAIGFDADIDLRELAASPGGEPAFSGLSGALVASERSVRADRLEGTLGGAPLALSIDARIDADGGARDAPRADAGRASCELRASVVSFDLARRIEPLVGAVDPVIAQRIARAREARAPSGEVDLALRVLTDAGEPGRIRFEVEASNARLASFAVGARRLALGSSTGSVALSDAGVVFHDLRAPILCDGAPAGTATLDGAISANDAVASLRLRAESIALRSGVVGAIVDELRPQPAGVASPFHNAARDSAGLLDADLTLRTGAAAAPHLSGDVTPRSLSIVRRGVTLDFPDVAGRISIDGERGEIHDFRAAGPGLVLAASGRWALAPAPSLDARFSAEADRFDERVRALLPLDALEAADAIDLDVAGPVRLDDGALHIVARDAAGAETDAVVSGVARFESASARAGVAITEARGSLAFRAHAPAPAPGGAGDAPTFDLSLAFDDARIERLLVTGAAARIRAGPAPGEVVAESFDGWCHGGRFAGVASVSNAPDGSRRFEVQAQAGGVSLASALDDLRKPVATSADEQRSGRARGEVEASLSLSGAIGEPDSTLGRGLIAISGGEVVRMPFLMNLIELSALQLPFGSRLDRALGAFHVRGRILRFEELWASSDAVAMVGQGALRLPDGALDLRFTSRGLLRLPLISDLFEGMRDEIATITVRGNLAEPKFGTTTLAGARAALGEDYTPDFADVPLAGPSGAPEQAPARPGSDPADTAAPPTDDAPQ